MKGLLTLIQYVKYESLISYRSKVMAKVKDFSQVQKSPRSRSMGQGYWYPMKNLATKNTYVNYENLCIYHSKVMAKVKVRIFYVKVGLTPRSRSKGQIWLYPKKGLVTKNTQVKYECHSST
jgi:hypothetical protein